MQEVAQRDYSGEFHGGCGLYSGWKEITREVQSLPLPSIAVVRVQCRVVAAVFEPGFSASSSVQLLDFIETGSFHRSLLNTYMIESLSKVSIMASLMFSSRRVDPIFSAACTARQI